MMKHLFLFCMLIPLALCALKVDVSVNKYTLSTSDQLELTLKVTDSNRLNVSEPQPPQISLLTFRNMTSSSASSVVLNGAKLISEFSETYKYIYFPAKTGSTIVPSMKVDVNNRTYSTRPIELTIVKGITKKPQQSQPSVPGFNPFSFDEPDYWSEPSAINDNTKLIALPETQYVYRGFPAIVSYYLYTDTMVRSFNLEEEKDFTGYGKSTYEQPSMLNYENVQINGKSYKRALVKRLAIMPNQDGKLQAPQLSGVARLYNFGYINKSLVSSGGNLVVRPLPKDNVPAGFAGAVGNFSISHSVSKQEIRLGEALTVTLKISGKGNFNQFNAPQFATGKGFQISSPMVIDNLNAGIEGTRSYYYTLIPQDKGDFKLPELKFVWFSQDKGSYQTYQIPQLDIKVSGGHVLSYLNRLWEPRQQRYMFPKLIRSDYPVYKPMVKQLWYWALVILIMLAAAAISVFALEKKLKGTNPDLYAQNKADKVLQHYMKHALSAAQNLSNEFYPLAEKALVDYLAAKYKLPKHLSTPEKLNALMGENIPDELLSELQGFLDTCISARYMPEADRAINLQEDLQRARKLIKAFVSLHPKKSKRGMKA